MNRKRGVHAPTDPAMAAQRRAEARAQQADPATWGLDRDALALEVNRAVSLGLDLAGRAARARRQDVFDLMSARGRLSANALSAVRRLQEDIARLHRTATGEISYAPRVDRSIRAETFAESRQRAAARIEAALTLTGGMSARLLAALCEPEVISGRSADWRAVVERETGEKLPDAQGALLRMACENLASAYGMTSRRPS